MHEWLQALRKSAKAASSGVSADEVRWAETECGVPFPEDLGHLYLSFNGGEFNGDVSLFPLHGPEGSVSVLEKTRLKLEGLPAAGVWRIGMKGTHRHLFSARKSAMVEQGDGGGPLPGWVQALGDDEWIYGTWEGEKREMRLYRTLKEMLDVLVPPAEVESFGERTFARALNAVLQGALSGVEADDEEEAQEEAVEQQEVLVEAEEEEEEEDQGAQRELAYEYDDDVSRGRKGGDEPSRFGKAGTKDGGGKKAPSKVAVKQVELFVRPTMQEALRKELGPEKKAPKKKPSVAPVPETKVPAEPVAKKAKEKEAVTSAEVRPAGAPQVEPVAKKAKAKEAAAPLAPATSAASKTPVTSAASKTLVTSAVSKAPGKESTAKKVPAKEASAQPAAKKAAPAKSAATKAPAQPASKKAVAKSAAKKAPAKPVAKKAAAKKLDGKKAPAKPAAKKSAAKKAPAKSAAKRLAGKQTPAKAAAKKLAGKQTPTKPAAKKPAAKKAPAKKAKAKR